MFGVLMSDYSVSIGEKDCKAHRCSQAHFSSQSNFGPGKYCYLLCFISSVLCYSNKAGRLSSAFCSCEEGFLTSNPRKKQYLHMLLFFFKGSNNSDLNKQKFSLFSVVSESHERVRCFFLLRWKLKSSCYHWSSSTEADSEIPSVGRFLVKFYTMAKGHQKHQKTVGKIPGRILEERFLCCILFLPTRRFLRLYNLRPLLLGQRTSLVWYLALSGSPPYFSGDKEHQPLLVKMIETYLGQAQLGPVLSLQLFCLSICYAFFYILIQNFSFLSSS